MPSDPSDRPVKRYKKRQVCVDLPEEVWRPIPGIPSHYEASNMGRIRSWIRPGGALSEERWHTPMLVSPSINARGYFRVHFSVPNGRPLNRFVHCMVLEAFVGPRPTAHVCRHLDGDPSNNRVGNLCWGTQAENIADKHRHGTMCQGSAHPRTDLQEADVLEIRRLYAEGAITQQKLGDLYNKHQTTIASILSRRTWKHI